ncbi:MAG: hypothetical protein CMG64_02170 [Candidatus Marinimicrobia bacterium]|nr:hypothetical protein [Candidatus Neomarinimicrobiota bacterium]|tara:strand:- start:1843 stop:2889 length:1047 start_codon:yes stop_codon:yes gene_type:complete
MTLGIDIGKYKIKIVELEKNNNEVSIKNIDSFMVFDDINKFNLEKITSSQIEACIQDLCKKMNLNPKKYKKIITSIPGNIVDVRQITTLDMPDEELSISLELEAKKHIASDGTDAIIDYHHLGTDEKELDKIKVILVSTTKNIIKEHAEMIKNSGFKPGIFDTDPIALSNIYQHNYELPKEGTDVIINIGNSATTLIVWGEKLPFFTRTLETAGNYFTEGIMRTLNVDYKTAEEMKFEKGIDVVEDKEETSSDIGIALEKKTVFNDLTDEIRKTLRYYMKNNNQSFFNNFYLSGGSANLPGLQDFIASNLNVNVEILNPINNIKSNKKIDNVSEYSTALGLALRGLEE